MDFIDEKWELLDQSIWPVIIKLVGTIFLTKKSKQAILKILIRIFGALLFLAGLVLIFKPSLIFILVENSIVNIKLIFVGILVRLIFGFLLIKTSSESRYPSAMRILGIIFLVAAAALLTSFLILKEGKFDEMITLIIEIVKPYPLVVGVLSMMLGGFLMHAYNLKKGIVDR